MNHIADITERGSFTTAPLIPTLPAYLENINRSPL